MKTRILAAIDDSRHAEKIIDFIKKSIFRESVITLFGVVPSADYFLSVNGFEPDFNADLYRLEEIKMESIAGALKEAKKELLEAGYDDKDVIAKQVNASNRGKTGDVADVIIDEAGNGYDVIVIGRKGKSEISEFLFGSVAQKVIHKIADKPVLIVN